MDNSARHKFVLWKIEKNEKGNFYIHVQKMTTEDLERVKEELNNSKLNFDNIIVTKQNEESEIIEV